ncbi:hypothetical protein WJX84_006703 [Apatococcus fuscideae]|uniref:Mediator of RNA polymerase II transcription subunit 7 n=1 Tax=Apatococcus fuscideae TaxID=2026836 RepID=A0AAW1T4T9_9CHLO
MEEQTRSAATQLAFPSPPAFFRLYREDADGAAQRPLPPDPPEPIQGEYEMFGELHTTAGGMPPLEVAPLYEFRPDGTIDFREQLRLLNKELLFNFLRLLDYLVDQPSQYARQVEQIGQILRNMRHLLNLLRVQQAHATLHETLAVEMTDRQQALSDLRQQSKEAEELMQQVHDTLQQHLKASAAASHPP